MSNECLMNVSHSDTGCNERGTLYAVWIILAIYDLTSQI